jgi:acetate kinase
MKILIINSGSSSIKFQLLAMPQGAIIAKGLVERIGFKDAQVHYKSNVFSTDLVLDISNHQVGLKQVADLLLAKENGVIANADEIKAVGHRVVHGGSVFTKTTLITNEVKQAIKHLSFLAPLHNPANLIGIEVAETIFTNAKQIAVFDTAFHQSIPEVAHRYAIPNELYEKEHIRVYGFHGTSHKYVSQQAIEYLNKKNSKIISIHLGNGCSMTAIQDGKSIDHSLGFGPMNGLIMGTRSGDIDQSVVLYLAQQLNYSLDQISNLLQKKSGMLGLTGMSDLRDIENEALAGNKMAQLALAMNTYRIKKYIGAYTAVMNGLDALIFTAGIGENSSFIRTQVCNDLSYLGIALDKTKNDKRFDTLAEIQSNDSKVKVLVVPTNEELEIANQAFELLDI